jgi:hypothetical protein
LAPAATDFQRVDIQAAVGFVHQAQDRIAHGHLEDFVPLLLAAGEALVDARFVKDLSIFSRSILSFMSFRNCAASSSGSPRCLWIALTAALRK